MDPIHLYDNTSKDTGPGRPGEAEVYLQDDHLGRMWIITISTTTLNCLWYGHGAPLVDADPLGEYDARDKKSAYAFPEPLWPWTQAGSKKWSLTKFIKVDDMIDKQNLKSIIWSSRFLCAYQNKLLRDAIPGQICSFFFKLFKKRGGGSNPC